MTTRQELNDSFDSLATSVLRVKKERDELLKALKALATSVLRVKKERDELLKALKAMLDCEFGTVEALRAVQMARKAVKNAEGRA
jgi:enoyl reductase-like protein